MRNYRQTHLSFLALLALIACSGENTQTPSNSEPAPEPIAKIVETQEASEAAVDDFEESSAIRQANQHVHGDAKLGMALDGQELIIQLESPIFNLTGFEHEAATDEQVQRLAEAEKILSSPAQLFAFDAAAGCVPATDQLNVDLGLSNDNDHHSDHDDDDDHDHHDDEAHAEHDHKDIIIDYTFKCATPDALVSFTTNLFAEFPEMTALDAVFLGPSAQLQATLTPDNSRFDLTR